MFTEYNYILTSDGALYHHGVKGMKWGVRNAVSSVTKNSKRLSRAISAANIEDRRARIERSISKAKSLQKRHTRDYRPQIAKYKIKIKQLDKLRNKRVSDLSDEEISRGRSVYKTMKNVSVSVAVTAASTAVGTVSMPAGVATKLVGAGLNAVLNDTHIED